MSESTHGVLGSGYSFAKDLELKLLKSVFFLARKVSLLIPKTCPVLFLSLPARKLTQNPKMEVWKMMFLLKTGDFQVSAVHFPGAKKRLFCMAVGHAFSDSPI